jgi:hypothetical protein
VLSAQSIWVRKEVVWWLEHRSSDRLLIVVTDGVLAWDSEARDFDSRTNCVGWQVAGEYVDHAISGAKERDKRAQFDRMLHYGQRPANCGRSRFECRVEIVALAAICSHPPQ